MGGRAAVAQSHRPAVGALPPRLCCPCSPAPPCRCACRNICVAPRLHVQGEPPAKRQAIDPFGQYALQPQQQYMQPSLGVGLAPAQQQNYNGLLAQIGQRQVRDGACRGLDFGCSAGACALLQLCKCCLLAARPLLRCSLPLACSSCRCNQCPSAAHEQPSLPGHCCRASA